MYGGVETIDSYEATCNVCAGNVPAEDDNSEANVMRRKVLGLHVLLLRIALRLGQNPRSSLVQQVVYRCAQHPSFFSKIPEDKSGLHDLKDSGILHCQLDCHSTIKESESAKGMIHV
jgi:hypothetical protein